MEIYLTMMNDFASDLQKQKVQQLFQVFTPEFYLQTGRNLDQAIQNLETDQHFQSFENLFYILCSVFNGKSIIYDFITDEIIKLAVIDTQMINQNIRLGLRFQLLLCNLQDQEMDDFFLSQIFGQIGQIDQL